MKVKVELELDINEKQYDDHYCDYFHRIDRDTMELIKTKKSINEMHENMKIDLIGNAQRGILEWSKRLHIDVKIHNSLIDY